jgi:hypothetical protein
MPRKRLRWLSKRQSLEVNPHSFRLRVRKRGSPVKAPFDSLSIETVTTLV